MPLFSMFLALAKNDLYVMLIMQILMAQVPNDHTTSATTLSCSSRGCQCQRLALCLMISIDRN